MNQNAIKISERGGSEEVVVSIHCLAYNHEPYIRQCLDGFLAQKTNFKFEVLIHDDASTDKTAEIIREYELKYPEIIKPIYQTENQHSKHISILFNYQLPRAHGKYIAYCEGDDYWIDPYKLQKQYDFLENHPEYIATTHNVVVVDKSGNINGEIYPECKDNDYTIYHYVCGILPGQTASLMCRNYLKINNIDLSILKKGLVPGDLLIYFALLCNGKIYCFQEIMSAYRHVISGGDSYSAQRQEFRKWKRSNYYKELMLYVWRLPMTKKRNKFAGNVLYIYSLKYEKRNGAKLSEVIKESKIIKHKFFTLIWWCIFHSHNKKLKKRHVLNGLVTNK